MIRPIKREAERGARRFLCVPSGWGVKGRFYGLNRAGGWGSRLKRRPVPPCAAEIGFPIKIEVINFT